MDEMGLAWDRPPRAIISHWTGLDWTGLPFADPGSCSWLPTLPTIAYLTAHPIPVAHTVAHSCLASLSSLHSPPLSHPFSCFFLSLLFPNHSLGCQLYDSLCSRVRLLFHSSTSGGTAFDRPPFFQYYFILVSCCGIGNEHRTDATRTAAAARKKIGYSNDDCNCARATAGDFLWNLARGGSTWDIVGTWRPHTTHDHTPRSNRTATRDSRAGILGKEREGVALQCVRQSKEEEITSLDPYSFLFDPFLRRLVRPCSREGTPSSAPPPSSHERQAPPRPGHPLWYLQPTSLGTHKPNPRNVTVHTEPRLPRSRDTSFLLSRTWPNVLQHPTATPSWALNRQYEFDV